MVGTALLCGDRGELGSRRVTRVFVIVVSRALIDTRQNTGFMFFPIETAAAFPSQTVAALPLPSTAQSSLDPLSLNYPWASAVVVRLVQQHQTQVPLWPQLQGTRFWPQTGQPQQWSTPRSPLGLTGPPPTTLQGMSANNLQSPLPPPPTWDANASGFGCGDGGRQDASLTGWNASGKGYKGNGVVAFMEFSDRDPIPKWDFQEPGARLRPWFRELSFGRHDTSTPVHKHGVKQYKTLPSERLVGVCRINFRRIKSVRVKRHHFRSYLEAEPEVQAEVALYQTMRAPKGTFVECTSRISNKLREMESGFKELLPPKLKGFIIKRQAKLTHDQAKHLHFYVPTRGLEADKMVDALNNKYSETERSWGTMPTVVTRNQTAIHAQAYPMEGEKITSTESNHHHNHKASSDTESDQLDWDPERIDDDGYPLVNENGPTLVPIPREGPLF